MDRRLDERFPAHLDAKVTDLATRDWAAGTVADISSSGVCVISMKQFAPNAVVKLEVADSVLFGSVVHCTETGSSFRVGIELVRVLLGGSDIANLLNAVLVEVLPATPGVVASTA